MGKAVIAGAALAVLLSTAGAASAADPARPPALRLQNIRQAVSGGCIGSPDLDARIAAELKQLTGRAPALIPAAASNPLLTPADPDAQVFGGYVEPIDNGSFRARLWIKNRGDRGDGGDRSDHGTLQVAVRDMFYANAERLGVELPQDAAALILFPDFTRTASATPYYCGAEGRSAAYPEDACDVFLPPPGCGVPFVCPPGDQTPRCATGPSCGVAGRPACPAAPARCRVRDFRLGTGIAALLLGGVGIAVGGILNYAATDGRTHASSPAQSCGGAGYPDEPGSCYFNGMPAAITSYVGGGVLLGAGAGLLADFGRHARTTACEAGK